MVPGGAAPSPGGNPQTPSVVDTASDQMAKPLIAKANCRVNCEDIDFFCTAPAPSLHCAVQGLAVVGTPLGTPEGFYIVVSGAIAQERGVLLSS